MNSDARTAFRQGEIRDMNNPPGDARSDFRRQEILEMNAEAGQGKMAMWGLLGLAGVLVLSLVMKPSRSKR